MSRKKNDQKRPAKKPKLKGEISVEDVRLLTEQIRNGSLNEDEVAVILGLKKKSHHKKKAFVKTDAEKTLQAELEGLLERKLGLRPKDIAFIIRLVGEADERKYTQGAPDAVTLEHRLQIVQFARLGFTPYMIAKMIGLYPTTLKNYLEKHPDFAEKCKAERLQFFYYLVTLLIRSASKGNPFAIEKLWNRLYPEMTLDPMLALKLMKGNEDGTDNDIDPATMLPNDPGKRETILKIVEEQFDIKLRRREIQRERLDAVESDSETSKVASKTLKDLGEQITEGKIVPSEKRDPEPDEDDSDQ